MKYCDIIEPTHQSMNEGKNPNPRIYQLSEAGKLIQEYSDFIEQMTDELQHGDSTTEAIAARLTQLIANTRQLKAKLENDADNTDMYAASISFNDAAWEFYQIVREKYYIRKHQGRSAISRSGMFPSSRTDDDDDNSSRDDVDMDVQEEQDGYLYERYDDSPRRGDYDHEEEAS